MVLLILRGQSLLIPLFQIVEVHVTSTGVCQAVQKSKGRQGTLLLLFSDVKSGFQAFKGGKWNICKCGASWQLRKVWGEGRAPVNRSASYLLTPVLAHCLHSLPDLLFFLAFIIHTFAKYLRTGEGWLNLELKGEWENREKDTVVISALFCFLFFIWVNRYLVVHLVAPP